MRDDTPTCDGCSGDPEPQSAFCADCAWDLVWSWREGVGCE